MSNITDYLFDRAGGLITRQPEIRDEGKGYEMADTGGVELEVGEFLYGLVRLIKPQKVLSTGIYTGVSDMYIAQGLKDNGYGRTDALEIDQSHIDRAIDLWTRTDVASYITPFRMPSLDFEAIDEYDLFFLDSEPYLRFAELVKFYDKLKPGGFVFMHDLHHHLGQETIPDHEPYWPWGELPQQIKNWMKDGDLKPWYFPNPRGMSGWQKVKQGDYGF